VIVWADGQTDGHIREFTSCFGRSNVPQPAAFAAAAAAAAVTPRGVAAESSRQGDTA